MPEPAEERPTNEIVPCPRCGAEFLAEVCPEGMCPRCLLRQGLEEFPDTEEEEPQKDGTENENSELVPGQVFGPYRILGVLGEGGMGRVYLAEQEHPVRRQVALKVIKLGMDTREVLARFDTERQALAMMDHPNIAKVLDAGASELGRPYFVMEYEPGIPITEYCDKNRLSNRERLELLLPVCHAVHHAHQKGIIHRDLKASNILITLQDGRPVPKVIDFGVAKATNHRLTEKTAFTQFGSIVGTPEYMSPEQARTDGLDIDTRTDIYSLGVLLYELLVGVLPFDSKALRKAGYDEIRRIIREEEPPKPTTRLHTLSASAAGIAALRRTDVKSLTKQLRGDLDWIVMKALEKDRARRYASASELAADLQRHLSDEPLVAGSPSRIYRLRKFARKNRELVLGTAVVMLCLVIGAVVSTVLYFRAESQRELATRQSYIANLKAAQVHLRSNELVEAQTRLLQCDPVLRGWEWEYVWSRTDTSTAKLYGWDSKPLEWERLWSWTYTSIAPFRGWNFGPWNIFTGPRRYSAARLTFSPDGRRIHWMTPNAVHTWDADTYSPISSRGAFGRMLAASPDGSTVIIRSLTSTNPEVFESVSGKRIAALGDSSGPLDRIISAAFSPDGSRVATHEIDGAVRLWDSASGKLLTAFGRHRGSVDCLTFSQDGERLLSGSRDGTAWIWNVRSGARLVTLGAHTSAITAVSFCPDGKWVASADASTGQFVLWDSASGTPLMYLGNHVTPIITIAFSRDGRRIAAGHTDSQVEVFEILPAVIGRRFTGKAVATFGVRGRHLDSITFSPDGRRLFAGLTNGEVRVWDAENYGQEISREASTFISSVAFQPSGDQIAVGMREGTVELWDSTSAVTMSSWRCGTGGSNSIEVVTFSPDGRLVATGLSDGTVILSDARSGSNATTLRGHTVALVSLAFSPDGVLLASGSKYRIRIWDLRTREIIRTLDLTDELVSVSFSPDGGQVLSACRNSRGLKSLPLQVWNVHSGKLIVAMRSTDDFPQDALGASFTPDGKQVIGVAGASIWIWDAVSGKPVMKVARDLPGWPSFAMHPSGKRIATAAVNSRVQIWDTGGSEELSSLSAKIPTRPLLAFSPDGTRLLILEYENTQRVRILDTKSTHDPAAEQLADSLYKQHGLVEDVVRHLETDASIDERLRSAAIKIVRARGDDPRVLQWQAWRITRSASQPLETYRKARRQAEKAYELSFQDPYVVLTLGAARYRTGAYSECLATLSGMEHFPDKPRTLGLIFAAMARERLGQTSQARTLLQFAHGRVHFVWEDDDYGTLFNEANSIIFPKWWVKERKASK